MNEPTILEQAEAARGSRQPVLVGDEISDDHNVIVYPGDSRDPVWLAQLTDARSGTVLWWARGGDLAEALTNLCLVLGDELEERARFVPERYTSIQGRARPDAESAVPAWTPPADARCRACGCTESDCSVCVAKTGRPCGWVAEDLCSACVEVHEFDPHPLDASRCAYCDQPSRPGDPVCQLEPASS